MKNIDKSLCQISRLKDLSEEFLGLCAPSLNTSKPITYTNYSKEEIDEIKNIERERCAAFVAEHGFDLMAIAIRTMK